jgi:hypothetical protein
MGKQNDKLKQANRKYKHDRKRRLKTFAEKKRQALAIERTGRRKNEKRRLNAAYVNNLEAELLN